MGPKRGTKQPADNDDSDDNDKPTWDSNERNLMLYLLELKRWLPRQYPQLNNFSSASASSSTADSRMLYSTQIIDRNCKTARSNQALSRSRA